MILPAFIRLTASNWYWALIALVAALALVVIYYRRTIPPLSLKVKLPLAILRGLAVVALFLALADAIWAAIHTDRRLYDLVVLLDHSASMQEPDDADQTRYERVEDYLADRLREPLGDRAQIQAFLFDADVLSDDTPADSFGTATAIGTALESLSDRLVEFNPRAAVILSDGSNNRGIDPATASGRLGVPIVTVGFGQITGTQAHVANVDVPDVVLTDESFDVGVTLQSGERDEVVTLRLASHGKTLTQQQLSIGGGARTPVTIPTELSAPGVHDLRLDVIGADGKSDPSAGRTVFVRALKGRLKVLLLGGSLDWEYTYLKRWLAGQSRVDLTTAVLGRGSLDGAAPASATWNDADVVIFVHASRREISDQWSPYEQAFAAPGRGVAFVLDSRYSALGPQPLPFPFDFQRAVTEPLEGEFTLDPLATRQNHPLVRFEATDEWDETLQGWTRRPPWVGIAHFSELPADADVLVTARRLGTPGESPAVWTRTRRGGKALVLTGGPMWRWVADRASRGEDAREYDAFWGNTIRWLSLRDDTDRLAVRTDRQVYHVGEPILVDAAVYDEVYRFLDRAEVTARIWADTTGARDTVQVFLPPGAGDRFVGQVSHLAPGTYNFDGVAVVDSVRMALTGGVFRVEPYGLEQQSVSLNDRTLRDIALQTGGRYYRENETPAFLDSLDWTVSTSESLVETPIWNKTYLLAIFIGALTIEWFVRRRRQLL